MRKRWAALLAACCLLFGGCTTAHPTPQTKHFTALDTACTVSLYDGENEELLTACVSETARLERLWSRTVYDSDVARVNAAKETTVSEETAALLTLAVLWNAKTDGAFDITVAPYKDLWTQADGGDAPPSTAELEKAGERVGTDLLAVEGTRVSVPFGTQLDLGGIAKGAVADALTRLLKDGGATSALIDLGGNITAVGRKPDGAAFVIGIEDPRDPSRLIAKVALSDATLSTSGSYERYFEIDGKRYSHILDPQTGRPVENDLLSVTILSASATEADVLSTACFVMGYDRAKALVETLEGIEAVFVLQSGEVVMTDGVQAA